MHAEASYAYLPSVIQFPTMLSHTFHHELCGALSVRPPFAHVHLPTLCLGIAPFKAHKMGVRLALKELFADVQ